MLDSSLLPLEGTDTRLRPLADKDAQAFAEGTRDADVRQYGHLPEPTYTPDSVRAMVRDEVVPGLARGSLAVLTIADVSTDDFCGSLVLFDVTDDHAEVGFWLHPAHRGTGRITEALDLAVSFVRRSGLSQLTARTVPVNTASRHVLTRAGFVPVGRTADRAPSGHTTTLLHYVYDITRTDAARAT
ncbi:Putative acetyltransferase, ribosomal protein N-acetylase [Corynebacterium glyciniphilum AJ 3170]|uniref:Putative acetyltransferase, ribosomal protein N-acetylase n=1 Tax=Corynebacterium glyciniphilum AJ 3170 TaxID=1404245 RepID=X5DK89_9CORY|nr:GNAT family N-acetyltransferase [Corynebacterium glyciniphilum]AHW63523.1 Putative acetyltransferase, ribosomal protein N-acetylase [Corynebacterium glyciniphilum AJ 3170]